MVGSVCSPLKAIKANLGIVVFLEGDPTLPASFQRILVIEMLWDNLVVPAEYDLSGEGISSGNISK